MLTGGGFESFHVAILHGFHGSVSLIAVSGGKRGVVRAVMVVDSAESGSVESIDSVCTCAVLLAKMRGTVGGLCGSLDCFERSLRHLLQISTSAREGGSDTELELFDSEVL